MKMIDLRRDTITLPSEAMRRAAFEATLGDSVYDEDPTQRELEAHAAALLGKDDAIFTPSGTMANLTALLSHTRRGDEIIVEENAHIRTSETGGAAAVGGLMIRAVPGEDGAPDLAGIDRAIRPDDIHQPATALICLENTHNRYGGIVTPVEKFQAIRRIADKYRLPVHLDGARVFNAALFLRIDVKEIAMYADSVMVSLSKGLGAPVGSVLCGSKAFIARARHIRKMLGGGMRQTGWLCACGLVALSKPNIEQLKTDHDNAHRLAVSLAGMDGITVDLERTHTNFVIATLGRGRSDGPRFVEELKKRGVLATCSGSDTVRFVTSREVDREDIETVIPTIEDLLKKHSKRA